MDEINESKVSKAKSFFEKFNKTNQTSNKNLKRPAVPLKTKVSSILDRAQNIYEEKLTNQYGDPIFPVEKESFSIYSFKFLPVKVVVCGKTYMKKNLDSKMFSQNKKPIKPIKKPANFNLDHYTQQGNDIYDDFS